MKHHCPNQKFCDGNGNWISKDGCLPCPATMGGSLRDCPNRKPLPLTEKQAKKCPNHAAKTPSALRAMAIGIGHGLSIEHNDDLVRETLIKIIMESKCSNAFDFSKELGKMFRIHDSNIAAAQECMRVAAARMEELQQAIKEHSCNYKIGHPQVTKPCELCLLEKSFE